MTDSTSQVTNEKDDSSNKKKPENPSQGDQQPQAEEEDEKYYSTEESEEEDISNLKKDGTAAGTTRIGKPAMDDRALNAILAERRRSLENAKAGREEELLAAVRGGGKKANVKAVPAESEEIQAARNPMKWLADINSLYERGKRNGSIFDRLQSQGFLFEPLRELEYREHHAYSEVQYFNQIRVACDRKPRRESIMRTEKLSKKEKSGEVPRYVPPKRRPQPKSEDDNPIKNRILNTKVSLHLSRELRQKRRLLGFQGKKEVYTDKDRAAAVTLGDQDIKTSLKVQQKNERKIVIPEDMDANVYLTEAQKNISTGNHKAALVCASKAVSIGGPVSQNLLMRSRCYLLLGKLNEALVDAQNALEDDPSLVKALLVQAEALYTMGEFERALVLFHRGNRRRADISAFKKGVNKAREAILNAIGGAKFPTAKRNLPGNFASSRSREISLEKKRDSDWWKSTEASNAKANERRKTVDTSTMKELDRQKRMDGSGIMDISKKSSAKQVEVGEQDKMVPLVTEIKTSKMASKRLLGGLSSDKEFLHKLLTRGDLSEPKFRVNLESSRQGRRKSSVTVSSDEDHPGAEVINAAKEALSSLQYLEAFLWQRDPGGLSVESKRKSSSVLHRSKATKKAPKITTENKNLGKKSNSKNVKRRNGGTGIMNKKETSEKVSNLLQKLKSPDCGSLSCILAEAETFVEELRQSVARSESYAPLLVKLLTAIGKVLPLENRGDDGIAVLRDAAQMAKERDLLEEFYQASDALGRVLATEGHKEEAEEIWEALNEVRPSSHNQSDFTERKNNHLEVDNNNLNPKDIKTKNNADLENMLESDSGVDTRS